MVRSLLWKEWREQRGVVLAGLCLSVILPLVIRSSMAAAGLGDESLLFAQVVTVGTALFAWPLLAAVTAAAAHAERGVEESGFLLSRPVSSMRVWSTKVAAACAALLVVIAASFGVAQAIHHRYLGEWLGFPFVPGSFSAFALSPTSLAAVVAAGTALVFACTTLWASMTRNPLVAAALGVVTALAFAYLGFFLQTALAAQPAISGGSGAFLLVFLGTVAVGILIGASVLFRAGFDRHAPARRRGLVAAAVAFVVASTAGFAAGMVLATDIDPALAGRVVFADFVPSRSQALIEVNAGPFKGQSFWLAGPQRQLRQITRRMSDEANVAPGGEWVVYETRRGDWGLRHDTCMMRRVRLDGSDDQLVLDQVPCHAERLFSVDGTRVALRIGRNALRIISLDGGAPALDLAHGLPESEREELEPLRWVDDDRHILLAGYKSIRLLDVATGSISEVFQNPPQSSIDGDVSYGAWRLVPSSAHVLVTYHRLPMTLVDLSTGETVELAPACGGLRSTNLHTAGAEDTFWLVCGSGNREDGATRISLLRPGEVGVTPFTTLSGSVGSLLPSPSGDRLFLTLSSPRDAEGRDRIVRHYVVDDDGNVHEIEGLAYVPVRSGSFVSAGEAQEIIPPDAELWPWSVDGWLDEETLAVSRGIRFSYRPFPPTELGYIDMSMSSPVVLLRIEDEP